MSSDEPKSRLTQLAEKYCVDKLHSHSYIPAYSELFDGLDVRRILELGVGYESLMKPFVMKYIHGASLKMWEEYWPEAQIFSADIREDTLINEGQIRSFVVDQSSAESLATLVGKCSSVDGGWEFDVVIDDGSHQLEHQWTSLSMLLPV